ncbi:hypothetical protein GCM10023184_03070 [Flaviaesturariibacter amylovorans]|uniref:Choice-of-anchor D domain-containing protein n=2 Tax=Flaviaesturariibacter amylovorans TaxID=1084520 RepID=A0ABP8G701_9BACT
MLLLSGNVLAQCFSTNPTYTPTANADAVSTGQNTALTLTPAQLIANDVAATGSSGALVINSFTQPSSGTLTQDASGNLVFTPAAGFSGTVTFSYTIKHNDGRIAFTGNGHYYEYIPGSITWTDARNAAAARTYFGMRGYLTTVTSQAENDFIREKLRSNSWLGASDLAYEGQWRWVTGPEGLEDGGQGRLFSQQQKYDWCSAGTGYSVNGNYHAWAGAEPNDCGSYNWGGETDPYRAGEHVAHFYSDGSWNDFPDNAGVDGYVVEYGGLESCSPQLTSTATVTIRVLPAAGALHFDGTNDAVSFSTAASNATNFTTSSSFTMEAWVNLASTGGYQPIFTNRGSGSTQPGFAFFIYEGKPYLESNGVGLMSSTVLSAGTWTHVAFTYSNGTGTFYVNGAAAGSRTGLTLQAHAAPALRLGAMPDGWAYFRGSLDEARIWNRALCAGELNHYRNAEVPGTALSGLLAYYKFNHGYVGENNSAFTVLKDASANGYDGTLNNFALSGSVSNWVAGNITTTASAYPTLTASIAATRPAAFCQNGTLVLTATPSSGVTYQWYKNGSLIATATASSYTASEAGAYYVVVSNGCTATSNTITVTNFSPLQLTATGNATSAPGQCNGSVTLTPSGGTAPYSFNEYGNDFSNTSLSGFTTNLGSFTISGGMLNGGALASTGWHNTIRTNQTFARTAGKAFEGTFRLGASGATFMIGWTTTGTFNNWPNMVHGLYVYTGSNLTVYENGGSRGSLSSSSIIQVNTSYDFRIELTTTGAIYRVRQTGSPTWTWSLTTSVTNTSPVSLGVTHHSGTFTTDNWSVGGSAATSNLCAGTYAYTVTDANGCIATASATVAAGQPLSATATGTNATCFGTSTGSITVAASGGTAPYTYSINNGTTYGASNSFANLAAGTYTVRVKDNAGVITSAQTVTIGQPAAVTTTIAASGATTFCAGESVTLTASGADTYTWSNGATGSSITVADGRTYTVTGSVNGCTSAPASVTTTVKAVPTVTVGSASFCAGNSATLTATGADSYSWSTGTTGNTISVNAAGSYSVTGSTDGCASAPATATVTVNALPTVTISSNSPVNAGSTLTLTASGADTYVWSGPNGFSSTNPGVSVAGATIANAGAYSVTGTDANGCSATASSNALVRAAAKALHFDGQNDWVSTNMPAINAIPVTLEALIKPELRPEGNVFYPNNVLSSDIPGRHGLGFGANVYNGGSRIVIEYKNGFREIMNPAGLVAGQWIHIAVVYNNGNVKTYVNGSQVDNFDYTQAALNGNTDMRIGKHNDDGGYGTRRFFRGAIDEVRVWNRALCADEINAQFHCQLAGSGNGLVANYSFDNGFDMADNSAYATLPNAVSGVEAGVLRDFALNGATSNWIADGGTNATCTPYVIGDINVTGNGATIYSGTTATGIANNTNMGSTPPAATLSRDFVLQNTGTGALSVSAISLTGTDATRFSIDRSNVPASIPAGGSATFTVRFSSTALGTYTATVNIASNDCDEANYTYNVSATAVCPAITATVAASGSATICQNAAGNAAVTLGASATPADTYTYQWFLGGSPIGSATGAAYNATQSGSYSVKMTDPNGCSATSAAVTVTIHALPVVSASATLTSICPGTPTTITATGADTYTWSNGATGASITVSTPGSYTATGTRNGCTTTAAPVVIAQNAAPSFSDVVAQVTATTGANGCTSVVTYPVSATGTPAPAVTYVFTGATTGSGNGTGSGATFNKGTTRVTVKATNGCGAPTVQFDVIVRDNAKPVPSQPSLSVVTAECSVSVTAPTATDNCDGTVTAFTNDATSFTTQGTYTINWIYKDAAGNSETQSQQVIVKDVTAPVFSAGSSVGNVPAHIRGNVPEASQYNTVYQLEIPVNGAWNGTASVPYAVNNAAALAGVPFTRVAYYMELNDKWVWVSMDKFTSDVTKTGIPNTNAAFFQQRVSNMNVVASANAGVTPGTGITTGNIEFWNNCYGGANGLGLPSANSSRYDYDDAPNSDRSCYGSFQVHNYGAGQTLFAYNSWANNTNDDLGIGNNPNGAASGQHPDWTFAHNAGNYNTRRIYVFINTGGTSDDVTTQTDAGRCAATVAISAPAATDNCSSASVTGARSDNQPLNAAYPKGATTITWTATDAVGNRTTRTQTVNVEDRTAPVPTVATLPVLNGECSVTAVAPTATDNCAGTVTATTTNPLTYTQQGTYTITWTYADTDGNSSTQTQQVVVKDISKPVPVVASLPTISAECATVLTAPKANDNCAGLLSATTTDATTYTAQGTYTVNWTYNDGNGNIFTQQQTVVIKDETAPVIANCPANIVKNVDPGKCGANVDFSVGDLPPQVDQQRTDIFIGTWGDDQWQAFTAGQTGKLTQLDLFHNGCQTTAFTLTIYSGVGTGGTVLYSGAHNPGTFCGNWFATQIPAAAQPQLIAGQTYTFRLQGTGLGLVAGGTSTPVPYYSSVYGMNPTWQGTFWSLCFKTYVSAGSPSASASDNCGVASFGSSHQSGDEFPVGVTTVTYTAVDIAGNRTTCSFTVTVKDNEKPTITAPAAVWVATDAGVCSAGNVALGTPATADNCEVAGISNNAPATFPVGTTNVTWTVTDIHGNSQTAVQSVTVSDRERPVVRTNSFTISLDASGAAAITPEAVDNGSTDNCGIDWISIDKTTFDCSNVGANTVTLTVTDIHGNRQTGTAVITVEDKVAPVITCPADVTLNCQNPSAPAATGTATATDACGIASITHSDVSTRVADVNNAAHYNYTITRTWTATDNNGNRSQCVQTITVKDVTAPVPQVMNLPTVTAECAAAVTAPKATDNCAGTVTATTVDPLTYSAQGTYTIRWVYTDPAGNTSTQNQTVIVKDVTPPVISCAFNITVNTAPNSCGAVVTYNAPSASDNCGNGTLPTSLPGYTYKGTYGGHTYFISNTATTPEDAHAKAVALGGHLVTISDAQENAFVSAMSPNYIWIGFTDRAVEGTYKWITSEPVSYTRWNGGEPNNAGGGQGEDWAVINWGPNGTWNDWYYTASALYVVEFEGGSIPTRLVSGLGSGATFPIGTTTETWEAVDAGGNRATCSFTVTVVDNQNPTIVGMPANISVSNDAGVCGAVVNWTAPTSADNCTGHSIARIAGPASGSVFPIGTTTVTYRATDASGRTATASFTVTVSDTEAPAITGLPADISVLTDAGVCGARVTWTAPRSTDNCTGHSISQVAGPASGSVFPVGTTTISYRAVDAKGNNVTRSFTVTVADKEAPVLVGVPADVTVECDAVPAAAVVTATDNCAAGAVQFAETRTDGNCGFNYTLTRVWTVTDIHGNVTSATQVITVQDTKAPSLSVTNISVSNDAGQCGAQVSFAAISSDNCGTPAITYSHQPGAYFPVGTTTVTATATDACGNATEKTFTVTVTDSELPAARTQDLTIQLDATGNAAITPEQVNNGSSDNCAIESLALSKTAFDCSNVGANTVTLTVTDIHGNVHSATAVVTVEDRVAPVISCPASVTLNCQDDNSTAATGTATATDACGIANISHSDVSTQSADVNNAAHYNYTISRTWTATDNNGNRTQCVQTITVQDVTAPVITCPASVTLSCEADNSTAANGVATATDNCAPVAIAHSDVSTQVADVNNAAHYNYVITRTWKATDISGNATTCIQTLTVQDVTAPVITTAAGSLDRTEECSDNKAIADALALVPAASDNCAPVTLHLVSDVKTAACGATYTRVRTWNFTDVSGNTSAVFTQTLTVVDRTAPVVTYNVNAVEHCYDTTSTHYTVAAIAATDNCTAVTYSYAVSGPGGFTRTGTGPDASGTFAVGMNTISWTMKDACGNTTTAVTTVRLNAPITGTFNSFTVLQQGALANTIYLGYTPASSATIKVTAGGGTPGYTYQWRQEGNAATFTVNADPSSITVNANGAGSVTFVVTVTDSKGCKAVFTKTIQVIDVRCGNKGDKVLVCHATGSKSNPWVQICVAPSAVPAQLGNGSYLGTCTGSPATTRSEPKAAVEAKVEATVLAFPNPSRGLVNLRLEHFTAGKVSIQVIDGNGKEVLRREATVSFVREDVSIDLQAAAAGLYSVRISNGKQVLTTRVAIAR